MSHSIKGRPSKPLSKFPLHALTDREAVGRQVLRRFGMYTGNLQATDQRITPSVKRTNTATGAKISPENCAETAAIAARCLLDIDTALSRCNP